MTTPIYRVSQQMHGENPSASASAHWAAMLLAAGGAEWGVRVTPRCGCMAPRNFPRSSDVGVRADKESMELCRIVYISDAVERMNEAELRKLVDRASSTNGACGVTGLLLSSGGHFIQVLEGHPMQVSSLYERIARDPRHSGVRQLMSQPDSDRLFPNWGMQLANAERARPLDRERVDKLLLRLRLRNGADDAGEALILLQEFRQQVMAGAA